MRLDKFLKVSRLIKQRSRAKLLCDDHAVKVNGAEAKPGLEIKTGDELQIVWGDRSIKAVVVMVPERNVSKSESRELVQVIEDRWLNENWETGV